MRNGGDQLVLEQVEARLPVKTIGTGMGLRDEHMRKYVFQTQDGQTPDLTFTASNVACPAAQGSQAECKVAGNLAVRGVEKPFTMAMKIKKDGGSAFHASGDGVVKLSDYGIERPSQFGVKTEDEVKLRVEFTGKPAATQTAKSGGKQ